VILWGHGCATQVEFIVVVIIIIIIFDTVIIIIVVVVISLKIPLTNNFVK